MNKQHPIPFDKVNITGGFWKDRIELNESVTLDSVRRRFEDTGRFSALSCEWKQGEPDRPHFFYDSDAAKWMEAAAYVLERKNDKQLESYVEDLIDRIERNMTPDGYFNVWYTVVEPGKRFTDRDHHELYCAGHLIEAAVAYYEATGKRRFLDLMCRYAGLIDDVFRRDDSAAFTTPGHPEIELALVRLYRCTGEKRWLDLSRFFIDKRGNNEKDRGEASGFASEDYLQDRIPLRDQSEAVGHSVRACYLYSAMADIAYECGDEELLAAANRIFKNMTEHRMYITGGIGSTSIGEAFTVDGDLPNETAYAETCAAISLAMFAQRMSLTAVDSRYADIVERVIYNGFLSGTSLDGKSFFYVNPLEVLPEACHKDERKFHVKPIRQKWFGCACCPPNLARTVSSVASYAYTENDTTLFVHLYMGGTVEGEKVKASITSEFPWDGHVSVTCESDTKEPYTFAFRIPGWCASYEKEIPKGAEVEEKDGYLYVTKVWAKGETIRLNFPMEIQFLASNPLVREDAGRVAVKRGPVVYCMEEADNGKNLHLTKLCVNGEKTAEAADELGEHFVRVTAEGRRMKLGDAEKQPLYHLYQKEEEEKTKLKLIPYYMWNNRGEGEMQVWIRACE